ncbi:MAG: TAXI family TRAP transporter solute-binding subunit [Deltaproteobacteria bacterium]|jgi:TRAP transporter TAXI family solute receptor|nr:TAXI family TRAP transporter solute-binding subunit [Deltaproteobacteria bacterium]
MKKITVILAIAMALVFGLPSTGGKAVAQESDPANITGQVRFCSMTVGGSWYIYAVTVSEVMKSIMPKVVVDVFPYQGGVGNPILVGTGKAEMGLSFSVASNWAYNGIVTYQDKPMKNLRALLGGLSSPYRIGIVVDEKLGVNSIEELLEKKPSVRLVTVQRGGLGEIMASQILEAYGSSYDDVKSWGGKVTHVDLSAAVSQMKDGQADMFIHNMSFKQPDITEMCLRGGLKFLPVGEKEAKYLSDKYGHMPEVYFEVDEFTGITERVRSIGYPTGIIATDQMSDEMAYAITKAVCENKDKLVAAHASMNAFEPELAGGTELNGFIPLHPGSEKYFKEKGYLK